MNQRLGYISVLVPDYDAGIAFYTGKMGFNLLEDTDLGSGKRWVLVQPSGNAGTALVLAQAVTEKEKAMIGQQGAGRVWLFLHTDDFYRDYHRYREQGITFLEESREESYATVAVFQDKFGN
ncbi:MAG: VOC family protein, partial [Verrucomicrobiae bacterium]|nr:VOC family protein [Verrucomicrobiae bacterium]